MRRRGRSNEYGFVDADPWQRLAALAVNPLRAFLCPAWFFLVEFAHSPAAGFASAATRLDLASEIEAVGVTSVARFLPSARPGGGAG